MTIRFASALIFTLLASTATAASFEISGFRNSNGRAICRLYTQAEGFPEKPARAAAEVVTTIQGGRAACAFDAIASPTAAVSVLHDEDGDGDMKTNFVGIPKEGWAVSNNAKAQTFGPPTFVDARFTVTPDLAQSLRMNY